jgi:predicted Zn-dependent protease
MQRAEEAFRRGQYDDAVRFANHAAVEMPNHGRVFLFMAQALFAVGDYGAAAGALHQGMAMSDPKEWGVIVQNFRQTYGKAGDFSEQLRRLEKFVSEHSDAAYGHFLLGFEYGQLGYPAEARRELAQAVDLEGRDQLAVQLLVQFGGEAPKREKMSRENRSGESDRPALQAGRDQEIQRDGRGSNRPEPRPESTEGRRDRDDSRESIPPPE